MSDSRDATLVARLPRRAPYSLYELSEAETAALEEALSDGFGDRSAVGFKRSPLPSDVDSGLLQHFFFGAQPSVGPEDYQGFWNSIDDEPPPFERFPLGFIVRRLRIYFRHQYARFCREMRGRPLYAGFRRWDLAQLAVRDLYSKPWYEFHALQLLEWIETVQRDKPKTTVVIVAFSGRLGRLVEQYYWRFRSESVAITGIQARKGASKGGKLKSQTTKAKQSVWQAQALEIWARRAELSKTAVAELIKSKLGFKESAKHIARYLQRP